MNIREMADKAMKLGIAFPSAEVYGGYSGFYDWGPVGAELKNNVKRSWWKEFVHGSHEVIGLDGSIITNPEVWKASGHVEHFHDPIVVCKSCGKRFRADHIIEDALDTNVEGKTPEEMTKIIRENNIRCPACGGELGDVKLFNLMFSTQVGPYEGSISYLRPETAQLIFVNFPRLYQVARKRMPLGIAQIGKAFRNEISPRNFLFRLREFEQMEIEFFFDPENDECPYYNEVKDYKALVLTAEMQERGEKEKEMKIADIVPDVPGREWLVYWIVRSLKWYEKIGVKKELLRVREQLPDERAHYSQGTWDIEFYFEGMGWKEIQGIAHRGTYDLSRHQEHSGKSFEAVRPDGTKFVPMVIEPSWGVDRVVLAVLFSAYDEEEKRTLFRFAPIVAPYTVAVFPLVSKGGLPEKAWEIYMNLLDEEINAVYDEKGSIGRRYRRQDEIGTPWCITVDYQTLEDDTVTIRDRDTMEQERIPVSEVVEWIRTRMKNWSASQRK